MESFSAREAEFQSIDSNWSIRNFLKICGGDQFVLDFARELHGVINEVLPYLERLNIPLSKLYNKIKDRDLLVYLNQENFDYFKSKFEELAIELYTEKPQNDKDVIRYLVVCFDNSNSKDHFVEKGLQLVEGSVDCEAIEKLSRNLETYYDSFTKLSMRNEDKKLSQENVKSLQGQGMVDTHFKVDLPQLFEGLQVSGYREMVEEESKRTTLSR